MNEESNLGTSNVQATPAVAPTSTEVPSQATVTPETPAAQPVSEPAPVQVTPIDQTTVVQPAAPAETVQPTPVQTAPAAPAPAPAPAAEPVAAPATQPVQEVVATPDPAPVEAAPVETTPAAPAPAPAATTEVQPAAQPVESVPVTPAETTPAAPVEATPVEPAADPNQIFSNPTTVAAGIITPKGQAASNDVSAVGFVAGDISAPKKKNKVVPIVVVVLLFAVLGTLGYFVVYPYVLRTYFSNPYNVYNATIKASVKSLEDNVDEFVHTKAIYNAKFSFDTNIENLKSFSGYKYGISYGVDPNKKAIQYGASVNDTSNVEHSYYNYLKDGKNYIRYSSYRELIFNGEADMDSASDLNLSFNQMLDYSKKLNNQDLNYLLEKTAEYTVNSIDQSKLTKDDASINVNGKNIKVINNIYTVNNTTLRSMLKSIADSFSKDEKALGIIAGLFGDEQVTADSIKKTLEELDVSKVSIDKDNDNTYITFSIYTYGNKNSVVGWGMNVSDDSFDLHQYSLDSDYSEMVIKTKTLDTETNKEVEGSFKIINKMVEGKRVITCISDDKEIGKFTLNTWNDAKKDIDYELSLDIPDQPMKLTGSLIIESDVTDERSNYNIELKINSGKEYINFNSEINIDWSSEVANINTLESKELSDADLINRKNDFINTLKTTPVSQMFSTVSDTVDQSTIRFFFK